MGARTRALFCVASVGLFSSSLAVATAAGVVDAEPRSKVGLLSDGASASVASHKADFDRDRLFDDLEDRMGTARPDEEIPIIVSLKGELSTSSVDLLASLVGPLMVERWLPIINGFSARAVPTRIRMLAAAPGVVSVEESSAVHVTNDTAQSSFGITKARLDQPSLDGDRDGDSSTYSSNDVVAAVIDTGIDPNHLDLDDGKVIGFKDLVSGKSGAYDDHGHGTHVSATIAGDGEARQDRLHMGVAPGAALVGVKVLDANGSGSMADVTAGIDWVVSNKDTFNIKLINLSLGSGGCSDGTDATSKAVNNATAAGITVVVAAGNAGPGTCTIGSPAAAESAVTVGAMSDLGSGGFGLASFSSRGPTADNRIKPDVAAPGVSISSAQAGTVDGYVTMSGTSMATPFVVGTALLMLDGSPSSTPQQIKSVLTGTTQDWARGANNKTAGSTGPDIDYGAGRLDAYAALSSVMPGLNSAPSVPSHVMVDGTLSATGAVVEIPFYVADPAYPLNVTMIEPGVSGSSSSSPDVDMYLFDANGSQVGQAESSSRQESISISPVQGSYTLRMLSYKGSGTYVVDMSGGFGTAPPPPPTATASPSSFKVLTGSLSSGSVASLSVDDELYLQVKSNSSYTRTSAWQAGFMGIPSNTSVLKISYSGKNSRSCTQTVDLWRFSDSAWVKLDSRSVGTAEVLISDLKPAGKLSDHVGPGGEVRVRVRCQTRSGTFTSSGDLVKLTYSTP